VFLSPDEKWRSRRRSHRSEADRRVVALEGKRFSAIGVDPILARRGRRRTRRRVSAFDVSMQLSIEPRSRVHAKVADMFRAVQLDSAVRARSSRVPVAHAVRRE
jgi:hypothetical protein